MNYVYKSNGEYICKSKSNKDQPKKDVNIKYLGQPSQPNIALINVLNKESLHVDVGRIAQQPLEILLSNIASTYSPPKVSKAVYNFLTYNINRTSVSLLLIALTQSPKVTPTNTDIKILQYAMSELISSITANTSISAKLNLDGALKELNKLSSKVDVLDKNINTSLTTIDILTRQINIALAIIAINSYLTTN